jgi:hypothetical protein
MNLNDIMFEGSKLSEEPAYADALTYLNAKFAHLNIDQVKAWLTKYGTTLSDGQVAAVQQDTLLDRVPKVTDPALLFHIEEILEELAKQWGIESSTYRS